MYFGLIIISCDYSHCEKWVLADRTRHLMFNGNQTWSSKTLCFQTWGEWYYISPVWPPISTSSGHHGLMVNLQGCSWHWCSRSTGHHLHWTASLERHHLEGGLLREICYWILGWFFYGLWNTWYWVCISLAHHKRPITEVFSSSFCRWGSDRITNLPHAP